MPNKDDILDLYFMDARHKLIDIAAFLDRVDRHDGEADFRFAAFHQAMNAMLETNDKSRAQAVLEALSDSTSDPIAKASTQGATGAYQATQNIRSAQTTQAS
ncbi:MAG: hypothetical protein ACSHX0_06620 [Akkermansiaceae bacterium]